MTSLRPTEESVIIPKCVLCKCIMILCILIYPLTSPLLLISSFKILSLSLIWMWLTRVPHKKPLYLPEMAMTLYCILSVFVKFQICRYNLLDSWMNAGFPVCASPQVAIWHVFSCLPPPLRSPQPASAGKGLQIHPAVGLRLSRWLTVKNRRRERRGRQQQPRGLAGG